MRDLLRHEALIQFTAWPNFMRPINHGWAVMNADPMSKAIDTAQFGRLLAMAGPCTTHALLTQLQTDFSFAKHALLTAQHGMDWPQIRAQSHVIMGLAGTIGAGPMHKLALQLNDNAHDPMADPKITAQMISEIVQAIDDAALVLSHQLSALGHPA